MGERKGQLKWYPPDFDPAKTHSLNQYWGTHALRERAKKIKQGIVIIRFELPYNIWCDGCGEHIGMGVRYNAEKSKIGYYYSTPIFQFKMKCHLCPNFIVIKTDPANQDYVITSGARRKEQRWDPSENEQIVCTDRSTMKKLALDPMYKLEHGVKDKQKVEKIAPEIHEIEDMRTVYKDDYFLNRMARDKFRSEKKTTKIQQQADDVLRLKSSLDIELLPESEKDKKIAALMKLSSTQCKHY